ncbi:sugar phosphate isomerase/epimerase family protein [Falsiroseomonas selenitidurans]|uniref:Sugar phosphate isomerase/epimerase n=1 Tax=Falsiroseomonas selenitidurans TaxID=2716335 RepID=A0ABX1EDA8_9PROT|nr:TIM barrel protein [Falsiroseomonas selenitidurans]NKC33517.1 sugar phosphate isomerase/epimerase [Falsiroseomonas selenitidurans]
MTLLERIGVDVGRRLKLEDAIAWAGAHGVRHIDIQLDTGANAVTRFDAARARGVRALLEKHQVHLGLHTLSAVNVAEYSPFLSEAVDSYMRAYIEAMPLLGAESIVVHAGYHFTADVAMRMQAGLDRLRRMVDHAEKHKALLLLENLNKEPADAEVHYLAHTVAEWKYYYDAIDSPAFALSFTANHAHLLPEGVAGFLAEIPMHRVVEVRLADCWRNGHEQHLVPGEGDFDFGDMFRRIEAMGFKGHYMNAFGTLEQMEQARHGQVAAARAAGVAA